jgi:hypothetical protein
MTNFTIGPCLLQPLWAPGRSQKPTAIKRVSSEVKMDTDTINTQFSGTGPSTARHCCRAGQGLRLDAFTNTTADELSTVLWWARPGLHCILG